MTDLWFALVSYLMGTIPSAYICGRIFQGKDIRYIGSGNIGTANALKHIGYGPGIVTLIADIAKGAIAVFIAARYGSGLVFLPLLSAFLVILGHNYNIFLGFKGGKGLASLAGTLVILSPVTILYVSGVILILILIIRDTNTAAGMGILSLPVFLWIQNQHWFFTLVGAAMALLVISKHRKDILAYRQGRRTLI